MHAAQAYEAGRSADCASELLELERTQGAFPLGGELLAAECLGQAGRIDDAFAFLRRQLPSGRVSLPELRSKVRPGLEALRANPGWPSLLAEAEAAERKRTAQLDPSLRNELLARAAADQLARSPQPGQGSADMAARMRAVDHANTRWLAAVLDRTGWPGRNVAGDDGAQAAWMLAQHADDDPAFQRRALGLLAGAAARGDASLVQLAYLTDRVLVSENRPQRYGTQYRGTGDGNAALFPAESPGQLDLRRRRVGLPPLAEQERMRLMQPRPAEDASTRVPR